ncbi:uncharacterized protein LOC130745096 [Lotus japonicus]|uniref:uncharacterized protein LOC130745096 n=1 Tax=Lotus japonicus TaxID=34305 RepID=UPI00258A0ADE|nr:uncharacterized protein LOC130745096 [Lotus japonicus]
MAMNNMRVWLEAQETKSTEENTTLEVAWKAPTLSMIKINLDAGWTGTNSLGFGFVARSHTGAMLVAGTHVEEQCLDPLMAEALAMRWCMLQARELGMDSVIFESDFLSVIRALRSDSSVWTIQNIIQDCQALARDFMSISFSHVKREANSPAHALAFLTFNFKDHLWWDVPPAEIEHLLFVDAAFS